MFLDAPPVVFKGVEALCDTYFFTLQVTHPEDVVFGPHHHAATFEGYVCQTQHPGFALVRHNVDSWEQATEANQVVQVVNLVRVPVVFRA